MQPADFTGENTPYHVILTGTDIPPGSSSTDVSAQNKLGTWIYSYTDCQKIYGSGAKGKIDGACYEAWIMSNTAGVASDIDWNNAAALKCLGAPGLNKGKQAQI